ncbi:MAG TPA: DUF4189 domain-containing protein [Stellaceae bacterium]|jgi:serine/threonine-protein kinase
MRRLIVLACVMGALLAGVASARAQIESCSTICDRYDQGECVHELQTCTKTAPPKPNFGAIAYSPKSGAWGYSYSWNTKEQAETQALAECRKNGTGCEVQVWYQRQCGAVVSADGENVYWGIGDGTGAAGANALASCKKDGGKNCTIQVEECSR